MAICSNILARKIPWTAEPGGLQFMELQSWTRLSNWAHITEEVWKPLLYTSVKLPKFIQIYSYLCIHSEKAMATHSSTLAWKIPWTEEPGRLQSMGSLRVRHDWATSLSLFTFMHWRRKWQPTPVFLPGESQGQRSLLAAVYGVAQSWTQLKRLSNSSSPEKCAWGTLGSSFESDHWFLYIPHRHRSWWAHLQVSFHTLSA